MIDSRIEEIYDGKLLTENYTTVASSGVNRVIGSFIMQFDLNMNCLLNIIPNENV